MKVLIDSRRSRARNRRDHAYASSGICSDSSTLSPVQSYRLSVEQVFVDRATAIIRANENFNMICLHGRTSVSKYGTLSWVPDWSTLAEVETLWLFRSVLINNGKFKNGLVIFLGNMHKLSKFHIRRGNILCVSGLLFDTVDALSAGISHDSETESKMLTLKLSVNQSTRPRCQRHFSLGDVPEVQGWPDHRIDTALR